MACKGQTVDSFSLWNARTGKRELYRLVFTRCTTKSCSVPWHGPYLYRRIGEREFYVGKLEADKSQAIMFDLLKRTAEAERAKEEMPL